jgi:AbrB family looped-hinge helix DNA binding protein
MQEIRTHIDANGRILIPHSIRKAWGIKSGDVFVIRTLDNEMRIINLKQAIVNAQNLIQEYIPDNVSLTEELFTMRREEVNKEMEK